MALPKTIENREYFAFKECNGNPAKRVSVCQEAGETIKVDIGDVIDGDASADIRLKSNDIIIVSASIL